MVSTEAIGTADGPCGVDSADISPISQPWRPHAIRVTAQALPGSWVAAKGLITGAGGHFWPREAFLPGLKCAASSTPIDPQIEFPGTYATGTLPLGPLWVSDVPGLVLGPSCGLLGLKTQLRCLFCYSPVYTWSGWLPNRHVTVPYLCGVDAHRGPSNTAPNDHFRSCSAVRSQPRRVVSSL